MRYYVGFSQIRSHIVEEKFLYYHEALEMPQTMEKVLQLEDTIISISVNQPIHGQECLFLGIKTSLHIQHEC